MTSCTCITLSDGSGVIRDPWCTYYNHGDPAFVNPGPDPFEIPTHTEPRAWPGTASRASYFEPQCKEPHMESNTPAIVVLIGRDEEQVYLTRRNLLALLSKLDRNLASPGESQCTLIKNDTVHAKYPCSSRIAVTAVEDAEYYDRPAGEMWPTDKTTGDYLRDIFERIITKTDGPAHTNAWPILERSKSGGGRTGLAETVNDGYLDLYVQKKWEMFKACAVELLGITELQ